MPPPPRQRRIGLVDIGSNAIRMQVVDVGADGIHILATQRAAVRLGAAVLATGRIPPELIDSTATVLALFAEDCRRKGVVQLRAVATAALRDAENREELVARVRRRARIEVEVISGAEEADLLARTMATCLDLAGGPHLLVDLGAGSVEVVIVTDGGIAGDSHPIGALRLTQAATAGGRPDHGRDFVEGMQARLDAEAIGLPDRVDHYAICGGSIEKLGELMLAAGEAKEDGTIRSFTLEHLASWQDRLADLPPAERMARFGLEADRADTIVAAAATTLYLGRRVQAGSVLVPGVDLKTGLLQKILAEAPER